MDGVLLVGGIGGDIRMVHQITRGSGVLKIALF